MRDLLSARAPGRPRGCKGASVPDGAANVPRRFGYALAVSSTEHFEALLELTRSGDRYRATVGESWMQGRSAFGGLTAALCVAALRRHTEDRRPLRSLDIAFVGPVEAGAVDVATEVFREGRSVTHAGATVHCGDTVRARAHAVFGEPRLSKLTVPMARPVPSKPRDAVPRLPFLPGITPTFTQHFDYRMCEGDLPFSGSTRATMGGYLTLTATAAARPSVEAIVAMTDAWPAPVMPLGDRPFPASSVRMSVVMAEPLPAEPGEFWFRSECVSAAHGYATVVGTLYAGDTPLAWMEQLVAAFDGG